MDQKLYEMCKRADAFDLDRVALHFAIENNEDLETVRSWIIELKKWLVMAAHRPDNDFVIFGAVDRLWHTFVLFTREYAEFCDQVAGHFIHHVPAEKIAEAKEAGIVPIETATLETSHSVKEIRASQVSRYRSTLDTYRSMFDRADFEEDDANILDTWFGTSINPDDPEYDPDKDPLANIWAGITPFGAVTCPTSSCCGTGGACGCIQTRP